MYKKLYNKLNIIGLTVLMEVLQKIDGVIHVDKLVDKYNMILNCDGYETYAVEYFACRYLYETETNVYNSVNKMIYIGESLGVEMGLDEIQTLIVDIASDIEYNLRISKRKFMLDNAIIVTIKTSLYEIISKDTGLPIKVNSLMYSYPNKSIMGSTSADCIEIIFKNSKIQKYLDVLKEMSKRVRDDKYIESVIITDEDNKIEYKELPDNMRKALDIVGIIEK